MAQRPADSAFTLLFRDAERVTDLYEFLTGKKLESKAIEIVQLKDKLYGARLYNDISFITSENELMVLIEHQSTLNPNMTFRLLEYYVKLAGENIKSRKINKFGTAEIQIPKAQFFVVYNGKGKMADLPLLDLGDVQVKAKVKNIHFDELTDKSPSNSVAGYARFIDLIQNGVLIDDALDILVRDGYLKEFLSQKEMRNMFAEVFSYDNELRQEGMQKGMQEGMQKGMQQGIAKGRQEEKIEMVKNGLAKGIDIATIQILTGLDEELLIELQKQIII